LEDTHLGAVDYRREEAHIRLAAENMRWVAAGNCLGAACKHPEAANQRWAAADTGWEAEPGLVRVSALRLPKEFQRRHSTGVLAAARHRLRRTQHPADMSRHIVGI